MCTRHGASFNLNSGQNDVKRKNVREIKIDVFVCLASDHEYILQTVFVEQDYKASILPVDTNTCIYDCTVSTFTSVYMYMHVVYS